MEPTSISPIGHFVRLAPDLWDPTIVQLWHQTLTGIIRSPCCWDGQMLSTRNDAPYVVWQEILVKFQRIVR